MLTNLRSNGKEGSKADWAAFEAALDSVFSEGMLAPRSAERRKELIAVLQVCAYVFVDELPLLSGSFTSKWCMFAWLLIPFHGYLLHCMARGLFDILACLRPG